MLCTYSYPALIVHEKEAAVALIVRRRRGQQGRARRGAGGRRCHQRARPGGLARGAGALRRHGTGLFISLPEDTLDLFFAHLLMYPALSAQSLLPLAPFSPLVPISRIPTTCRMACS